jgi:superfamily II DNA or RNA helicase
MAFPKSEVNVASVRKALTVRYQPLGAPESLEVRSFTEDDDFVYTPRQWGLTYCQENEIDFIDETSRGCPLVFPRMPEPRDYQVPVLEEIEAKTGSYFDFMFRARTGFGKTISGLIIAGRLGMSTLIIVDQENLKDQWIEALQKHFGVDPKDVGIIQGSKCVLRPITIAMIQTTSRKELPEEALTYFGFVLVDEVHTAGAPVFSQALMRFTATIRMGISATPKRRDGLQCLLEWNLGRVRVYVADAHDRSSLYIVEHRTVYSWYANSSPKMGRYINEIADDASRNLLVAEIATSMMDMGRDTLVLSDRIEQLTHISNLCFYLGVPVEEIGVYTGETRTLRYVKQDNPPRRPPHWERGTEYTPVELKLISKKTPKGRLQEIKDSARLVMATYQMFQKGVDVPRLRAGIDATPRSQAEQQHGRILRIADGDQIWTTIADTSSYRSLHQLVMRIPEYEINNAAVFKMRDDWSVEPCQTDDLIDDLREEVKRLKTAQIETRYAGLHTLKFPESLRTLGGAAGSGIRLSRLQNSDSPMESYNRARSAKSPGMTTKTTPSSRRLTPSPSSRKR